MMKNKHKFLLSLALSAGVIATFGASYALYKNASKALPFNITIGDIQTHTDSQKNLNYSIGTISSFKYDNGSWAEWGDDKLNPTYNKVKISVPLSFEYDSGFTFKQKYVSGTFSVSVSLNEDIPTGTKVSANLTGYSEVDSAPTTNYFISGKQGDFFNTTFSQGDSAVTKYIDTAIDSSHIKCEIILDFSTSITEDNFLDLAELDSAYNVTLNWGVYDATGRSDADTNLKPDAYIVGDMSDWDMYEDYALVPNLASSKTVVEWMYTGLKGASLVKVRDLSSTISWNDSDDATWVGCRNATFKQDNGNAKIDKDTSYDVYYLRNYEAEKGFWIH